ncbi:Protein of unknown function [Bacillus mycoides]|nr:Protein of unknown function [Bacillus mycoides]
MYTDSIEY